jgi:antitoxin VapB
MPANAGEIFDLLTQLPDDFMQDGRDDSLPQQRETF